MERVTGTRTMRGGAFAAAWLLAATPVLAVENDDEVSFATENVASNAVVAPPSEEALIFTGRDERPLTPSKNGFAHDVGNMVSGAKAFSTWLGPETWIILIAGFGLVGFVLRRSERVLRFEPRRDGDVTRRKDLPEDLSAASDQDASSHPRSGSGRAPSAPPDQAE